MSETTAIIESQGGPDVIAWREVDLPPPGLDEVRMRNTAVGLNFIDTYHRGGLYPIPLPSGLGLEAAGVVEAVGEGVTHFAPGDRVCTFGPALGAYATARNIAAASLFAIPEGVSDEIAAAALLKACTVEALVERCARVQAGWPVLVHAAAGGVGLLLVQWLKHIGATVIGTVSNEAKAQAALAAGANHIVRYDRKEVAPAVREITGGTGVRAVFDGVGKDTWQASLDSAAPRAIVASFGNASGPVTAVNLAVLAQKGSLFVTRPTLFDYYRDPAERKAGAARVFDLLGNGALAVRIGQRHPLREAAQAHCDLEARQTTGSTILLP
ncbi:MAG: quinone oxidoreductase [Novosphingobium sp.]|nr:quinone oxidoreductase [Novosphingobium sp.]